MDLTTLIPQHKSDIEAAHRALEAGYPTIGPILGELLEWMQDMNWPVAIEIETILLTVGAPLAPHILRVLQGDDDVWKYWILMRLVINFNKECRALLMDECIRISNKPTPGEVMEEVNLIANDILLLDVNN